MMVLHMLEVVKYKSRLLSFFASAYFTKLISIRVMVIFDQRNFQTIKRGRASVILVLSGKKSGYFFLSCPGDSPNTAKSDCISPTHGDTTLRGDVIYYTGAVLV